MPEGPEIRRAADRVAGVLVGKRIAKAELTLENLQAFESRLTGARVRAVDTRGKAMLTRFDNGLTLYSHNQLYGRWFTVPRGEWPATNRSLRVALHTSSDSALLYSASDIAILTPEELAEHPFLKRLGPDILDPGLEEGAIADRLDEPRFRRRSLAALYLDQGFLAGLGNYLRSEILFRARLDPRLRPADIDSAARRRLGAETLKLTRRSYETGGVTLPRSKARAGKRFWVFARASKACYDCGGRIRRENLAGRRIYHCPSCQASTS